jgi:hypothetical protein
VDLRGRLSNPLFAGKVREAADAFAGVNSHEPGVTGAIPCRRRWRISDRLGERVINELLADQRSGMTKPAIALRYGISLSSVKRLLRQDG